MNTEQFVTHVRATCVNELVERYAEMLTGMSVTRATDPGMRDLAQAWNAASAEMKATMKAFIRLGSQNTAATILALLDEDLGPADPQLSLVSKSRDGSQCNLGRDLLSSFWAQEESAGQVNQHRPKR